MRDPALWTSVSDHAGLTGMSIHPMFIVLKYVGWTTQLWALGQHMARQTFQIKKNTFEAFAWLSNEEEQYQTLTPSKR